jgi:hypothetical protein
VKISFETRKKMFRAIFRNPSVIVSAIVPVISFLLISIIVWVVSLLLAILIFTGMRLVTDPIPPPPAALSVPAPLFVAADLAAHEQVELPGHTGIS